MMPVDPLNFPMEWSELEYKVFNGSHLVLTTNSKGRVTQSLSRNAASWDVMQVQVFADGVKVASIPATLWAVLCTGVFWQRVSKRWAHWYEEPGTPKHDQCIDMYKRWRQVRR